MSHLQYEKRKRQKLEAQPAGPAAYKKRSGSGAEATQLPNAKRVKNRDEYEPKGKGKAAAAGPVKKRGARPPPVPVAASDLEEDEAGSEEDAGVDDSDDDAESEDEEEIGAMSGESDSDTDDEDDAASGSAEEEEDEVEDEGDDADDEDSDIPVTLEDCLDAPLYIIAPPESDVENASSIFAYQACVLCPGKLLKNQKMVDAHLASNSHMRAKKRMATRLLDPDSLTSEDPREIVAEIEEQLDSERSAGQKGIAGQGQPKAKDAKSVSTKDKHEHNLANKSKRENKVALRIQARKERKAARAEAEKATAA